jgi:hypothetical protein
VAGLETWKVCEVSGARFEPRKECPVSVIVGSFRS